MLLRSVVLVGVILCSGNVHAGWIIKEQTSFSDRESKEKRVVYVEGDRIKMEETGLTTIMDVSRDQIIFYNPESGNYWEGSVNDYDQEMVEGMREDFRNTISTYSDSAKADALVSFNKMITQLLQDTTYEEDQFTVQVSQTAQGEKFFGYPTKIYMVWVNKVATEEVWVAPDITLFRGSLNRHFWEIFNRITRFYEKGFQYQASQSYLYLMSRGYPVKVKEFGFRYDITTEVTEVKQKVLKDRIFEIPASATRVKLREVSR